MKFVYYNDTGRNVSIHSATEAHGVKCNMSVVQPLEERTFYLPPNKYPWEIGLSILVSAQEDED